MTTSSVPLASQVGGHPGVLSSEDGSLLFKPTAPVELHFYQTVHSKPNFAPLVPFLPKFYGTLKLEGKIAEQSVESGVNGGGLHVTALDESVKQEEKDEL
jgi:inositol-polyphosphate multikinase